MTAAYNSVCKNYPIFIDDHIFEVDIYLAGSSIDFVSINISETIRRVQSILV